MLALGELDAKCDRLQSGIDAIHRGSVIAVSDRVEEQHAPGAPDKEDEAAGGDFEHGPVEVGVDNKGAYDLCHRSTAGKNSRHVDRKVYKMRELQHSGVVKTVLVPTKDMRADMLTKSLDDETFARHRDTIMNTGALVSRSRLYGIPEGDHSGSGGV